MKIQANVKKLNEMIMKGQILEAFDKFYDEDVVMQENNKMPRIGKQLNRKFEEAFVASVKQFNGAEIRSVSFGKCNKTGNPTSTVEWFMDITFKNGATKKMTQVAVQRWKGNKIISERFYYDSK